MTTTLVLVRHGETAWNVEGRIQGHLDIPLNDTGLAQARAVGRHLRNSAFDAVYRPSYYTATAMFGYSRRLFDYPVTFNLRIENLLNEDKPLYYNTVQRPVGGDLSNPGRVATPNLFSYITPRNVMLTMSVKF